MGVRPSDNLLFRADRSDPSKELEIFQMSFKGDVVGRDAEYQMVRKMISLDDNSVGLLNEREIRIVDLASRVTFGFYSE